MREMQGVQSLSQKISLEEQLATHSSILAWKTGGTEQSMGSQRVGHDLNNNEQTEKSKKIYKEYYQY